MSPLYDLITFSNFPPRFEMWWLAKKIRTPGMSAHVKTDAV